MKANKTNTWVIAEWAVMWLAGSLVTVAIVTIVPGWQKISEWLGDTSAPAWVQAIGSILAIVGAGLIASWQSKRAEHSEQTRQKLQQHARLKVVLSILHRIDFTNNLMTKRMANPKEHAWSTMETEVKRLRELIAKLPMFEIGDPELVNAVTSTDLSLTLTLQLIERMEDENLTAEVHKLSLRTFAKIAAAHKKRIQWCASKDAEYYGEYEEST